MANHNPRIQDEGSYMPTEEEIYGRLTKEIQDSWDENTEISRSGRVYHSVIPESTGAPLVPKSSNKE